MKEESIQDEILMLLSELYRPPKDSELLEIMESINSLEENYSHVNIIIDKKTNDNYVETNRKDKIKIYHQTGDIKITKLNGNKFIINKKTGKRKKQKK